MRKRICAAVLLLCFVLSGCTSMLERDYVSATRHVEYHAEDVASVIQAESYQGLVSAILYFVTRHDETGVVHLSNYTGNVAADLEEACTEILEEDSIGAYALEDIEHEFNRIVSYYEVRLDFTYEHTADEVSEIWAVTSASTMFRLAKEALGALKESCAVNVYYLNRDKAALLTEMRQIWLDTPLVLEEPEVRVNLYPETGINQVVEYMFNWNEDREELSARSNMTLAAAQRMMEELAPGEQEKILTPLDLAAALRQRVIVDQENGGGTAYDALVTGTANRRGLTMALKVLCDLEELETTVVEGRLNGESAWWLIVEDSEAELSRQLDPNAGEVPEYGWDESFRALGYEWSSERYPACKTPPEPEQSGEGEDGGTEGEEPGAGTEEPVSPEEKTDEETGEKND